MAERRNTVRGARGTLGTLLVAWTLVASGALLMGSAYYQRTHDPRVLITWLAPPFVVGVLLFLLVAIVGIGGRMRVTDVQVPPTKGTRESIFRR